jgi:hypothetical protein
MHRLIVCFNALFLGIILGLIFLAIFHAPSATPHPHVATAASFEKPGSSTQAPHG